MTVAASKSSLPVALPKGVSVTAGVSNLIDSFRDPEAVLSESVKNPEATARKYAGLYQTMTAMEGSAASTKTYAGAYVARIMDKAGKGSEVAGMLGVSPSRVSQLRLSARLIFDFDFVPGADDTAALTSRAQNDKDVKAAIEEAAKSDASVSEKHDKVVEALSKWNDAQAVKAAEKGKGKGKPNAIAGSEKPAALKGNAAKLAEIHKLVGELTTLGHEDIAALFGVRAEIDSAIGATPEPVRVKGQALYGKARKSRTASPATPSA